MNEIQCESGEKISANISIHKHSSIPHFRFISCVIRFWLMWSIFELVGHAGTRLQKEKCLQRNAPQCMYCKQLPKTKFIICSIISSIGSAPSELKLYLSLSRSLARSVFQFNFLFSALLSLSIYPNLADGISMADYVHNAHSPLIQMTIYMMDNVQVIKAQIHALHCMCGFDCAY